MSLALSLSLSAGALRVQADLRGAEEAELGQQVRSGHRFVPQSFAVALRAVTVSCLLSAVSQFLELLTAQLLQSDAAAPSGLQLHVLDLYLTELAAVGAAEVTHRSQRDITLSSLTVKTKKRPLTSL